MSRQSSRANLHRDDPESAPLLEPGHNTPAKQPSPPAPQRRNQTSASSSSSSATLSNAVISRLCISHFLSAWNSRIFEFGSVLFLVSIWPGTLTLVSIYALNRCAAAILFAPIVGRFIDHGHRLVVVQLSIIGQRISVAVSCGLLLFLKIYKRDDQTSLVFMVVFGFVVVLAGVEKLCHILNSVFVTRDWVVEITENDPIGRARLNAQIRRIDLTCKLLGPLLIGSIDQYSTVVALRFTIGSTLASAFTESLFITTVYQRVASLHRKPQGSTIEALPSSLASDGDSERLERHEQNPKSWSCLRPVLLWRSLALYIRHSAFLPSFSYAFLQFTVLSFSGRMVAFLLALGYTPFTVGISRTVSTVAELSATFLSPIAILNLGSIKAAAIAITWQATSLTAGVAYFFIGPKFAITGLVSGVILSRIGLWVFDLSVHNIIQDRVESSNRGAFSTTEASVHNLFEMLSYVTTIVFARPEQFKWPMFLTLGSIYLACLTYTRFLMTADTGTPVI